MSDRVWVRFWATSGRSSHVEVEFRLFPKSLTEDEPTMEDEAESWARGTHLRDVEYLRFGWAVFETLPDVVARDLRTLAEDRVVEARALLAHLDKTEISPGCDKCLGNFSVRKIRLVKTGSVLEESLVEDDEIRACEDCAEQNNTLLRSRESSRANLWARKEFVEKVCQTHADCRVNESLGKSCFETRSAKEKARTTYVTADGIERIARRGG